MKFIHFLIFATLLNINPAWSRQVLKVGAYENYPKVFWDQENKASGLFVDILSQIAKNRNLTLEFVPITWPEAFEKLNREEIDIMPDVAFTKERSELVNFNKITVLSSWMEVFSLKSNPISSVQDLKLKKIGVLANSTQEKFTRSFLIQWNMDSDLKTFTSYGDVENALIAKEIDVMIADRFYEHALIKKGGINRSIFPTGLVFFPSTLHFVSKNDKNIEIIKIIDTELSKAINDPSSFYYQSIRHWLSQSPQIIISKNLIRWIFIISLLLLIALVIITFLYQKLKSQQIELKQTIDLLKKSQEEIIKSEKMKLLGVFTAGITHDLNNIFMPIIPNIQLLDLDSSSEEKNSQITKALGRIKKAASDGIKMVEKIKSFYKGQEINEAQIEIELAKEIPEIIDFLAPMIRNSQDGQIKHIEFEYHLTNQILIKMKLSDLREIINNIVLNAVDAIERNGRIIISASIIEDKVEITISDNGNGMPPEVREKCFDLLFTTKGTIGTGMGLPSVKRIIESYQGDISVESDLGVGTTLKITFKID